MFFEQSWKMWKRGFDAWDSATTRYFDAILRAPSVLQPSGSVVTALAKAQARRDKMISTWWSLWGLPTRREQERAMHTLHQLHSRLIDLEEQIEDLRAREAQAQGE